MPLTGDPVVGCSPTGDGETTCLPALGAVRGVAVDVGDGGDNRAELKAGLPGALIGGPGDDTLLGGSEAGHARPPGPVAADNLDGGGGPDKLQGGPGGDALTGRAGQQRDHRRRRRGRDHGEQGDDAIAGNGGDDSISGGQGSDVLTGGPGRDRVRGDEGDEQLVTGDDEFDPDGRLRRRERTPRSWTSLRATRSTGCENVAYVLGIDATADAVADARRTVPTPVPTPGRLPPRPWRRRPLDAHARPTPRGAGAAGNLTVDGASFRVVEVTAPNQAELRVQCKGKKRCPFKRRVQDRRRPACVQGVLAGTGPRSAAPLQGRYGDRDLDHRGGHDRQVHPHPDPQGQAAQADRPVHPARKPHALPVPLVMTSRIVLAAVIAAVLFGAGYAIADPAASPGGGGAGDAAPQALKYDAVKVQAA